MNNLNIAYFYLTEEGGRLAARLNAAYPGDIYGKKDFKENLRQAFSRYDHLVCIMATGIVIRILAPLILHKTTDPAVVVMDQKGKYAISLLSGHLGGANDLAADMAAVSGGQAVITTATDVAGILSFDSFAKKNDLAIENIVTLKKISGSIVDSGTVRVITDRTYADLEPEISSGRIVVSSPADYDREKPLPTVVIHEGLRLPSDYAGPVLYLRPRTVCAGIGCKRGMDGESIEAALLESLKKEQLSPLSLKTIATIPLKADEPGILALARKRKVPLSVIPTEEIKALDLSSLQIRPSDFVAEQTGVLSVSTASAYIASGGGTILRDKDKYRGITVALALCR